MHEVDKAVELLRPLLNGMAENRTVEVRSEKINHDDYIVVVINGAAYNICVECENIRQMIKSVVNVVALKL